MASTVHISKGKPVPLGPTVVAEGSEKAVNFALFSANATKVELCLFDAVKSEGSGQKHIETARLALPVCTDGVWHGCVTGISEGQLYGYRVHGPYAPKDGHRFNPHKLLIDPYAKYLDGDFIQHDALYAYDVNSPDKDLSFDARDSAPFMPKCVVGEPKTHPFKGQEKPAVPWDETIFYEVHVKGATQLKTDIDSKKRGTFAGLADPSMIAHFKRIGVTSIELLPVQAFFSEPRLTEMGLTNYWGYNPVSYFAPENAYCGAEGKQAFQTMVQALHGAGIEVILDVVYNHTAESWELGPSLSFRGIDNASYYRLQADDKRYYINDTGCGNSLNMQHPRVLALTLDSLRYWASEMQVDGFRFDLATTLARDETGFNPRGGFLAAIEQDPVLSQVKLIAEPWDIGYGGYRLGEFSSAFGEWNDKYRDTLRSFWRGDQGMVPDMAGRLLGSADCFDDGVRGAHSSVNFITSHDGFTLYDMVSYNDKHNHKNGEDNRDGHGHNLSDNCGHEGETDDPKIKEQRLKRQKNLLTSLMLSQGTPMVLGGDEMGHSQGGNNNAYCQDNETTWLNWDGVDQDLCDFVGALSALRKKHPVLRRSTFMHGQERTALGVKDITWLTPSGTEMQDAQWHDSQLKSFAMMLCGGDGVLVLFNNSDQMCSFSLPALLTGQWRQAVATDGDNSPEKLQAHSVTVLVADGAAEAIVPPHITHGDNHIRLNALADHAGIIDHYHTLDGTQHHTSDTSKAQILAAMGLSVESESTLEASLIQVLTASSRLLPETIVSRVNGCHHIPLNALLVQGQPLTWHVECEDGKYISGAAAVAENGFSLMADIGAGYHTLTVSGLSDTPCKAHFITAPHRILGAAEIAQKGGIYGVTAALYGLKSTRNYGLGDFEDLAVLAEGMAGHGADFIGINPVHALFPAAPHLYAPYSPSSRGFLNVMHIAVDKMVDLAGSALDDLHSNADFQALLTQARNSEFIDYAAVYALKMQAFERAYAVFAVLKDSDPRKQAFAGFCAEKGKALDDLALYDVLFERLDQAQQTYSGADHFPEALASENQDRIGFYRYLQWVADDQLKAAQSRAKSAGMAVGLYLDMAVGIVPGGADVWAGDKNTQAAVQHISLGAPGDAANPDGQQWNLAPLDPLALKRQGYAPFASAVRGVMQQGGAVRIDHVLGLNRSFWCPTEGGEGAYVTYPLDDLLGILALESQRQNCVVVGEDLGTVPDGFAASLAAWDMLGCSLFFIDRSADGGFLASDRVRKNSLASLSNHDFPTMAGFWEEADLAWRQELGIGADADVLDRERRRRADDRRAIALLLEREGLLPDGIDPQQPPRDYSADLNAALHGYLGRSAALAVAVQLEDLLMDRGQPNVPGTTDEQPNWRRKSPLDIDALDSHDGLGQILAAVKSSRT